MADNKEQRVCVKFCFLLGKSAAETVLMLQEAFKEDSSVRVVFTFHRGWNVMWGPAKIWPTFNLPKWWKSWISSQRNQCRSSSYHWRDFWDNWFVCTEKTTRNMEQRCLDPSPRQCSCPHDLECAAVFGKKQHDGYPSSSLFTRPCAMRLFPVSSYGTPEERETFCWCQRSEKENAGSLEHQQWRVPEMFSAVGKTLVQVYRVKRRVLWRILEL